MGQLEIDELKIRDKWTCSGERSEVIQLISKTAYAFNDIESASLDELLTFIGDARVVLLGESTHGTSEFYQMRRQITQELIVKKGFRNIAIEADWPDVEQVNRFIRHLPHGLIEKKVFKHFPSWMWKNEEFHSLILWLRHYNAQLSLSQHPVSLYGLDLYNLHQSIETILDYLNQKNPQLAEIAKKQYGRLLLWGYDPSNYGWAVVTGQLKECEDEVVSMLIQLLESYATQKISCDNEEFLNLFQNAVSIANAEEYYRLIYRSNIDSWNLRDRHMFETLETLLTLKGEDEKVIVWAHNSHVGHAAATQMKEWNEFNLGQLCKEKYKEKAYLVGFGTHKGTVAAASFWGGLMKIKEVRISHPESVERLFHDTQIASFFLPLQGTIKEQLLIRLLQRAIGVIYLPENELKSHYFYSVLPYQFDGYIWFDHTHAVTPLSLKAQSDIIDTYPFGV